MCSMSDTAQRIWEQVPNQYEARAWMREHPIAALGGGVAAGYLAARLWSRARAATATRPAGPPHALGDPRVFDRATSALWLIPLVELARIGLQAATYYMVATHRTEERA